jgi:ribonuclease HI
MPTPNVKAAPASAAEPASKKRKLDAGEQKYYAVRAGFKPGVYTTWAICQQQITGFKGAQCASHPNSPSLVGCALLTPSPVKSFLRYEDASAFAAGRDPPSAAADKPPRFYGVAVGRKPGVYTEWSAAQEAIIGWKGPKYKKFDTRTEAEAFVRSYTTAARPAKHPPADADADADDDEEGEEDEDEEEFDEHPAKRLKETGKRANARNGVVVVYTDGSSLGNGRAGASAGIGVYFGDGDPRCALPRRSPPPP